MKRNNTLEEIIAQIKKAKNILLTLHVNPDGDSIGSNLALYLALRRIKKNPRIYSCDEIPSTYLFLPSAEKIIHRDPADADLKRFDLFIALDPAQKSHLSRKEFLIPPTLKIINIDHHDTNNYFGDLNFIQPPSPSTAELVYKLLKTGGIKPDKKIATCLLAGLLIDTGGFRYPTTTPETLRTAADLLGYKANYALLIRRLFQSFEFEVLKIWGKYLNNLKIDEKYRIVWTKISYPALKRSKASPEIINTTHGALAGGPLSWVAKTKLAVLLTEERKGKIRGSLRTRKEVNSTKIAKALGGGGHPRAAGFEIEGTLSQAERKTLRVVRKYLRNQNPKH